MAWETRRSRRYYYRSRRIGRAVRRQYVGCGPQAEAAANEDEAARVELRRQRTEVRLIEAEIGPLKDVMAELDEGCRILMHGTLLAAGFHQHRGHWRKRRG